MSYLLAFAGSNSSTSINFKLVKYTVSLIRQSEIIVMDMSNMPFPMYSADHEKEQGYSNALRELLSTIKESRGLILSVNEHNGNPSAFFKNTLDWLSRMDRNFMEGIPVFLQSTSPGKRGGMGSLEVVRNLLPRFGAEIVSTFSLPSFGENFSLTEGIKDTSLRKEHQEALEKFLNRIQ